MAMGVKDSEFRLWRELIHRRSGILLGMDKAYLIEHRLAKVMKETGAHNFADLYNRASRAHPMDPLSQAVIDAMITNETFWFREPKLFELLAGKILPGLLSDLKSGKRTKLRFWSAACSTGQEPYSVAITALEAFRAQGREEEGRRGLEIVASDISRRNLEKAQRGIYDNISLGRGLDQEHIDRYFRRSGPDWELREDVRAMVDFRQINLREPFSSLGAFDLVFLRNVIIYFSEDVKREVFARLAGVMNPGALLFLGTGETLAHYSTAFEIVDEGGMIHYRLADRPQK